MAARAAGKVGSKVKASTSKVVHPPFLKTFIPARMAKPVPPLGPQLGKTDRSYVLNFTHPPVFFLLKLAAGCTKGPAKPGTEIAGRITLKHVYEIAKLKQEDPVLATTTLENICKMVIACAHRIGIEIISKEELDNGEVDHSPHAYATFLQKRTEFIIEQKRIADEKKQAKMLRLS